MKERESEREQASGVMERVLEFFVSRFPFFVMRINELLTARDASGESDEGENESKSDGEPERDRELDGEEEETEERTFLFLGDNCE